MDDLSWSSEWVCHGEYTSVCDAHYIEPKVNHDTRLSIVMIHQATILHGLSSLRGYWAYAKINRRLWSMGSGHISIKIGSLLMEVGGNMYSQ